MRQLYNLPLAKSEHGWKDIFLKIWAHPGVIQTVLKANEDMLFKFFSFVKVALLYFPGKLQSHKLSRLKKRGIMKTFTTKKLIPSFWNNNIKSILD